MLKGEAKKNYQRKYMRGYMRDYRNKRQVVKTLEMNGVKTPEYMNKPFEILEGAESTTLDADGNIIYDD